MSLPINLDLGKPAIYNQKHSKTVGWNLLKRNQSLHPNSLRSRSLCLRGLHAAQQRHHLWGSEPLEVAAGQVVLRQLSWASLRKSDFHNFWAILGFRRRRRTPYATFSMTRASSVWLYILIGPVDRAETAANDIRLWRHKPLVSSIVHMLGSGSSALSSMIPGCNGCKSAANAQV